MPSKRCGTCAGWSRPGYPMRGSCSRRRGSRPMWGCRTPMPSRPRWRSLRRPSCGPATRSFWSPGRPGAGGTYEPTEPDRPGRDVGASDPLGAADELAGECSGRFAVAVDDLTALDGGGVAFGPLDQAPAAGGEVVDDLRGPQREVLVVDHVEVG